MRMFPTVTPLPTVTAPPAPPDPKIALLPLVQTLSIEPFDQRTSDVDQFPAPSVGAVGFAPLASQVSVSARPGWTVPKTKSKASAVKMSGCLEGGAGKRAALPGRSS